jgi:hypothetical protein
MMVTGRRRHLILRVRDSPRREPLGWAPAAAAPVAQVGVKTPAARCWYRALVHRVPHQPHHLRRRRHRQVVGVALATRRP